MKLMRSKLQYMSHKITGFSLDESPTFRHSIDTLLATFHFLQQSTSNRPNSRMGFDVTFDDWRRRT